jgi:uncharacterized protein YdeI (YjbR/CyaY-like superfamily)
MNPKIEQYIEKNLQWKDALIKLHNIILDCNLSETLKWGAPCYMFDEKNIVLIHGFKNYCAILFMKGALLKDEHKILIPQTENVQSGRQIRFVNIQEIIKSEAILKTYILEAIEIEKAGLKIDLKKNDNLELCEEFLEILNKDNALKIAFEKLTPGRQRAYNLFFTAAKQPATRLARIEKYTDQILKGMGLNDCTCGLSKKMPACDGSHKSLRQ